MAKSMLAPAAALLLQPTPAMAQAAAAAELTVRFTALRSSKGMIRACLTRIPAHFLSCDRDPAALKTSVAAGPDAAISFVNVPPGDYALAIAHDENGNGKVDTFAGIPREGVGFSRDPAMRFGPPKWDAARFHVAAGPNAMTVKLKYFL